MHLPVIQWSSIPPVATELAVTRDPWQAAAAQKNLRRREEWERRRDFLRVRLTEAECEVLELLARMRGSNDDLALRLNHAEITISNHLSAIYKKYVGITKRVV